MSRAFVIERDEWFTCYEMRRGCKHANLRGDCTLDKCPYEKEKVEKEHQKEKESTL